MFFDYDGSSYYAVCGDGRKGDVLASFSGRGHHPGWGCLILAFRIQDSRLGHTHIAYGTIYQGEHTMMKRCLRSIVLFVCLLFPIEASAQGFSNMYIFGDSLSDTGNRATVTGDFPAPFFMNRVSNGQVAVEVLATSLGLSADASRHLVGPAVGTNYAVAGARAGGLADGLAGHGNIHHQLRHHPHPLADGPAARGYGTGA